MQHHIEKRALEQRFLIGEGPDRQDDLLQATANPFKAADRAPLAAEHRATKAIQ